MMCWFPYACTSIAETAGYKPKDVFSYYILAVPTLLTKTSVCTDPIIYFWLNTQFRGELMKWSGIIDRESSQSVTGVTMSTFYTRCISLKFGRVHQGKGTRKHKRKVIGKK